MVKKASREQLFCAAESICGRIFGIEVKYGPIVEAEIARRDKMAARMGIKRYGFV